MLRKVLIGLALVAMAAPAQAQFFRRAAPNPLAGPPQGMPPAEAEIWPFPPPDPKSWWDDKRPKAGEASDPLGGRRLGRNERLIAIDNGIDPSTYRLWGLMPLQWQMLRGEEMIVEVWVRPAGTVRQSVARVIVRGGEAFVQARAGLACCEADIGRRIGFDAKLPDTAVASFLALRNHSVWNAPREAHAVEPGADTAETLCVDGTSYDLTLVTPGRSRSLRRACDSREVGQAAEVIQAVLQAAMGHDPRYDVIYPRGVDFSYERKQYEDFLAQGGRLEAARTSRAQPPGQELIPQPEAAPAPTAAAPNPPAAPSTPSP